MDIALTETRSMALEHSECVNTAVIEILGATCSVKLQECENDARLAEDRVIIAVISLMGDIEWSVFLGLPSVTATLLCEKFAGFTIPFDSEDMGDAIGELVNILAGEVKAKLDAKGIKAEISLPSVMRAKSLDVLTQHTSRAISSCFDSKAGKLWTGVVSAKHARITQTITTGQSPDPSSRKQSHESQR